MAGNGVNHRKDVNEEIAEDMGPNLHTMKSSGAMTISPELFEKVNLARMLQEDLQLTRSAIPYS